MAKHAEEHHNAYPGFHKFTTIVQKLATLRNHPNILASFPPAAKDPKHTDKNNQNPSFDPEAKVLASRTDPPAEQPQEEAPPTNTDAENRCLFHDKKGHDLTNCKAFVRKTLSARMDWINRARLCFRCLSPGHQASRCKNIVKCSKCGSARHCALLHVGKRKEESEDGEGKDGRGKDGEDKDGKAKDGEEVASKCTTVCQEKPGGLSCAKIVLIDVFQEKEQERTHTV